MFPKLKAMLTISESVIFVEGLQVNISARIVLNSDHWFQKRYLVS